MPIFLYHTKDHLDIDEDVDEMYEPRRVASLPASSIFQ